MRYSKISLLKISFLRACTLDISVLEFNFLELGLTLSSKLEIALMLST